ncbi:hypothetical protein [Gemmatimonas sp.]|uniref:hypothetical protein n=1 Tax=Gemmatimonas sp. TaxID=1962908 RepID=UPI0025C382BD|nr:hypothetical protein [Gemmatimonas sp.]MCA2992534.1 hypothetical protein [Gemmatimonas sp.]
MKKLTTAERVSVVIAVLTLIVSAVSALPGFLALRSRQAAVLFESSSSSMVYPSTANRDTILRLLEANRVPTAFTRLLLSNRGDEPAASVAISFRAPGPILATRIVPSPDERPAWVRIAPDSVQDSSTVRFSLQGLAVGPTLMIEIGYLAATLDSAYWEIFADGKPAQSVASIKAAPENVGKISFRPALQILGAGLFVAILASLGLKATENSAYREALGIVLATVFPIAQWRYASVLAARAHWIRFKNRVVLALAGQSDVQMLSVSEGDMRSTDPREFWDVRLRVNDTMFGLKVHTVSQRFPGLVGSIEDQEEYCAKLTAMAQNEGLFAVIVIDQPTTTLSADCKVPEILDRIASGNPHFRYAVVVGDPATVAIGITGIGASTERPAS